MSMSMSMSKRQRRLWVLWQEAIMSGNELLANYYLLSGAIQAILLLLAECRAPSICFTEATRLLLETFPEQFSKKSSFSQTRLCGNGSWCFPPGLFRSPAGVQEQQRSNVKTDRIPTTWQNWSKSCQKLQSRKFASHWSGRFGVKCIFEIPLIMHWETIKAWEHFNNSPGCCQQAQRKRPIYTNFANLSRYLMDWIWILHFGNLAHLGNGFNFSFGGIIWHWHILVGM